MVLRKEEAPEQQGLVPAPLSKANPPYPTTPLSEHPPTLPAVSHEAPYSSDLDKSPAFNFKSLEDAKAQHSKKDDESDYSDDDEWNRSDDDDDFEEVNAKDVPNALRPAGGKAPTRTNTLPDALRPGPPTGIPIKRSYENISPMPTGASAGSFGAMSNVSEQSNGSIPLKTNNPYLKTQQTGPSNWGGESSEQVWGDSHGQANNFDAPVELPAFQSPTTPTHGMLHLQLGNKEPLAQPPTIAVNLPTPLTSPQTAHPPQDSIVANPWGPDTDSSSFDAPSKSTLPTYTQHQDATSGWQQQPDWERSEPEHRAFEPPVGPAPTRTEQEPSHGADFHPLEQTSSTNPFLPPPAANNPPSPPTNLLDEQPPTLPPRRSQEEQAPSMPPRPLNTTVGASVAPGPESPNTTMNRQRKEHYQIKHIRWHDVNKPGIRTSPILTQNLNGPCPLLALVNALVLSTPAGLETALVETLRTREQVSLGLLLDAVFDELMSGRRGTAAQELPDVSDLYTFLLALHTGLNVNPMFVPETDATNSTAGKVGGFENTADMKLYRTFQVPLIHGWLPEAHSEAHAAFTRVAKSYETSQYVQFQEEELDAKLQSGEALTADEQQMFADIHAIKEFLGRWPTQLTEQGLKSLRDNLQQGQVAILFRNDHFSTLFKDPRTDKLLTLVTDQGYSSHDEIVWESLVDVNGQGSELFSGDFRPVGNNSTPSQPQNQNVHDPTNAQGWTTVPTRRPNHQSPSQTQTIDPASPGTFSRAEQEDHDLALALQLQEEEEDRERREAAQRDRDNNASVSTIAAQSSARPTNQTNRRTSRGENAPAIPPRRNNVTTHRPAGEPVPPPTYEEAAVTPQYYPPQGHPASAHAPLPQTGPGMQPPSRPMGRGQPFGRSGRRQSAGPGQMGPGGNGAGAGVEEKERCCVM